MTGRNLDELRRRIAAAVQRRAASVAGDLLALQPRHESALHAADDALRAARAAVAPDLPRPALAAPEVVAGHVRAALDALASLGGQLSPDDVLGRVFATFCVGK